MFLKSFNRDISFKKLTVYWILFFAIGVTLKTILTPLSPSFVESEEQIVQTFCKPINMIEVSLAFFTETMIFFVLPWKWKGKKGAIIGVSMWIFLHFLTKNIPIAIYIAIIGYFYYRCLEIGRWKEIMFFHFIVNFPPLLSCFL
jgi:hypothetical protein